MNIFANPRGWLKKPWFVSVLVVVAILYVGKNIVLPLIDLNSSGSSRRPDNRTVMTRVESQSPRVISDSAVFRPQQSASAVTPTAVDPEFARLQRKNSMARNTNVRRNPFASVRAVKVVPKATPVQQAIVPSLINELVGVDANEEVAKVFKLKAVMAGKRSRLVLINREVLSVDETLMLTDEMVQGLDQSVFVNRPTLVGEYRVVFIGQKSASLVGPPGRINLQLESPY